jgi:hypothetical protein
MTSKGARVASRRSEGTRASILDASSPRSQQIQAYLEQQGVRGAGAAQIAAHQTRDDKLPAITHAEMQQMHREMAAQFGQQPEQVIRAAHERSRTESSESPASRIGADLRAREESRKATL